MLATRSTDQIASLSTRLLKISSRIAILEHRNHFQTNAFQNINFYLIIMIYHLSNISSVEIESDFRSDKKIFTRNGIYILRIFAKKYFIISKVTFPGDFNSKIPAWPGLKTVHRSPIYLSIRSGIHRPERSGPGPSGSILFGPRTRPDHDQKSWEI